MEGNKMSRFSTALLLEATLFAVISLCSPANAARVDITYTGTVSTGYDFTGVFGPNFDLSGMSYTAVYTLDTGVAADFEESAPFFEEFRGGSAYGLPSPLSAVIYIDGGSHKINDAFASSDVRGISPPSSSSIEDTVLNQSSDGSYYDLLSNFILGQTYPFLTGVDFADLTTPFSYTVQPDDVAQGYLDYYRVDEFGDHLGTAWAYLNIDSVTLAPNTQPVPEPLTLTMFVAGLAGAVVVRRRKKTTG